MRQRTSAVLSWAMIVCALCCASTIARSTFAQQAGIGAEKPVRIIKRRVIKLEPVAGDRVRPRGAPTSPLAKLPAVKLQQPVCKVIQTRQLVRPKIESKTKLPPAGAMPRVQFKRQTSLTPLPTRMPDAQPIPKRPRTGQPKAAPAVITAGGESIDDRSPIQQVVAQEPLQSVPRVRLTSDPQQTPHPQQSMGEVKDKTSALVPVVIHSAAPIKMVKRPVNSASSRTTARDTVPAKQEDSLAARIRQGMPIRQVAEITPLALQQPDQRVMVPIESVPTTDDVSLEDDDGLVTLIATGADLPAVLRMIADHHGLNLVLSPDISGPVTVSIRGARLEEVLDAILGVAGFAWHRVGNLLYVTGVATEGMDPKVQGRTLQVYPLDYVAAADLETVATGLLSPVGTVHVTTSSSDDQLKTRELLVVEDTVAAHRRIAEYIAQIDLPPRQVLIEAHVLQVALSEEERHGINWRGLTRWKGANITLEGSGFASDDSGGPSVALRVDGNDMNGLIELIRQKTNSRTLASPKVSVVNHQEAKIQIGQRLPYSVATTTQTSTIQNVQFLDVGIVLTVTPVITEDGNILMTVLPKVSGGKITESGFPEEDTTEVQTTVLMPDGGGIVIGGLIREDNSHARAIVPGLGRIPAVGYLFRRRSDEARRNELIVALVTHVLPDVYGQRGHELRELDQAVPNYSKQDVLHPPLTLRGCHQVH